MTLKVLFFLFFFYSRVQGQQLDATIYIQDSEPTASVSVGSFWLHSDGTLKVARALGPTNWITIGGGGGSPQSIPSGLITFVESGSCPTGFSEATALNGVTLVGTITSNADVGTTGGANNITPAGTIGALTFTGSALATHTHTFTGNALANHAHELPFQLPTATSIRPTAVATFGTGTSRAATGTITATANTTSAAVALSQSVSAGTPSGSNASITAGTPAGTINTPSFTGTQFDNRSAFRKVIFCKKD